MIQEYNIGSNNIISVGADWTQHWFSRLPRNASRSQESFTLIHLISSPS